VILFLTCLDICYSSTSVSHRVAKRLHQFLVLKSNILAGVPLSRLLGLDLHKNIFYR